MLKKLLLSFLLLASAIFAFSQAKKEADYKKNVFGLKMGTNFSWYQSDSRNIKKGGLKPGFSYGIMWDYNFQQNYSVSSEFLISTINGSLSFKDTLTFDVTPPPSPNYNKRIPNVKYEFKVRYIQIPISFKFRTKEIGSLKYFAQFGLAPAVRVSSRAKLSASGGGLPWPEDDISKIKTNEKSEEMFESKEFDDDVSLVNLPLIIGGGIEYNLSGNTSLYTCLRYENGFTNVLKSKTGTATSALSKNIALSIGVFF
jgi:hypothetical protein